MAVNVINGFSSCSEERPTYKKYKELLRAQRGKTSRLFNGWTKSGRCEMVANEILAKLKADQGQDKNLLLEVLNIEVLPKIDTNSQCIDLPAYETYEMFAEKLAISIASAMIGGFQIA